MTDREAEREREDQKKGDRKRQSRKVGKKDKKKIRAIRSFPLSMAYGKHEKTTLSRMGS